MFSDNAAVGTDQRNDYIKAANMLKVADHIKDKVSEKDFAKIQAIANTMGNRLINLKHFLDLMRCDSIFQKFMGPYVQNGVTREDLTAGLAQLGLPAVRAIMKKHKAGQNYAGVDLYNYQNVVQDSVTAEMDAILAMDLNGQPSKLLSKINQRMFTDATQPSNKNE